MLVTTITSRNFTKTLVPMCIATLISKGGKKERRVSRKKKETRRKRKSKLMLDREIDKNRNSRGKMRYVCSLSSCLPPLGALLGILVIFFGKLKVLGHRGGAISRQGKEKYNKSKWNHSIANYSFPHNMVTNIRNFYGFCTVFVQEQICTGI